MALPGCVVLWRRFAGLGAGLCAGSGRLAARPRSDRLSRSRYISGSARIQLQFKLDERTAHSSLDVFKSDTAVIYRMLGLDPSHVQDTPLRFRDWAVVLAYSQVESGRHYWEVTVRRSQEFRVGVAEVATSRDECIGTNSSSWVFSYTQRKWFAMTTNKMAPVPLVGKPDRVGLLLDFEAGRLSLVDPQTTAVVHTMKTQFRSAVCPAFALWDGEILTHSGLELPVGL